MPEVSLLQLLVDVLLLREEEENGNSIVKEVLSCFLSHHPKKKWDLGHVLYFSELVECGDWSLCPVEIKEHLDLGLCEGERPSGGTFAHNLKAKF